MNGFGQPLADGVKFILKEDYRPAGADKILFTIAPGLMVLVIIISIAVLPWGGTRQTDRVIHIPPDSSSLRDSASAQLAQGDVLVTDPVPLGGDNYRITYQYPFQIANLNIGVLYILAVLVSFRLWGRDRRMGEQQQIFFPGRFAGHHQHDLLRNSTGPGGAVHRRDVWNAGFERAGREAVP
jgi:hypothetical protein